MPRCGQERGNVRPLPTAASPEPLAKDETPSTTDLCRLSSIHPSACVTRERAAAPAAASVLPLGSTNLRLHPTCTGLVIAKPCQGQQSSEARAMSELSLTCPPNAHSKLQKPPHAPASPRRGGRRDSRRFEGSEVRPPCRRAVRRRPRRLQPPGQRTGGFCQLVRGVRPRFR